MASNVIRTLAILGLPYGLPREFLPVENDGSARRTSDIGTPIYPDRHQHPPAATSQLCLDHVREFRYGCASFAPDLIGAHRQALFIHKNSTQHAGGRLRAQHETKPEASGHQQPDACTH